MYTFHSFKKNNKLKPGWKVIILVAVVLIAISSGTMIRVDASTDNNVVPASDHYKIVDVGRGESLWSIAQDNLPPGMNIKVYMDKIRHLNDLKGSVLEEGRILYLP